MRLINADEFRKTMLAEIERLYRVGHPYSATVVSDVIKKLDLEPSVDAEPVVHGYWRVNRETVMINNFKCSVCGKACDEGYKICPHCGAKMDKE